MLAMKHTAPPPAEAADPVTEYLGEVETIAQAAPPADYVDPHIEDQIKRQNRAAELEEEGGIFSGDPDADLESGPSEEALFRGMRVDGDEPPAAEELEQSQAAAPEGADPIEATVAALRAANPKLTLKAALELAEKAVAPEASSVATQQDETPPPPPVADLKAELKDLRQKHRKALREYADDADIDAIEARMDEIEETLLPAAQQHAERQREEVARTFESYADRAVELYPEAAREGSPLYNRMAEIHADLEANGDPLVNSPEKALKIAQMAAAELHIAPKRAAAPRTPSPGTRSSAPMTRPISAAHARSAPPPVTRAEQAIDAIKSPEEFEAFIGAMA